MKYRPMGIVGNGGASRVWKGVQVDAYFGVPLITLGSFTRVYFLLHKPGGDAGRHLKILGCEITN